MVTKVRVVLCEWVWIAHLRILEHSAIATDLPWTEHERIKLEIRFAELRPEVLETFCE